MKKNDSELIEYYLGKYNLKDILNKKIQDNLKLFRFSPGEMIIRNEAPIVNLLFFVEGKAKVYYLLANGKSLLMRFYKPMEVIGEAELFNSTNYFSNIQAITEVICLGIRIELITRSLESNCELLKYFCKSLGSKLTTFNIASATNLMYPLENRLASYFIAISDDNENEDVNLINRIHTESIPELADLLGTSYRHLNRTIKGFADDGIIEKIGKKIRILDIGKLEELTREIDI